MIKPEWLSKENPDRWNDLKRMCGTHSVVDMFRELLAVIDRLEEEKALPAGRAGAVSRTELLRSIAGNEEGEMRRGAAWNAANYREGDGVSEKRIFNMNTRAEVKLTEYGKEVYSAFYRPLGIEFSELDRLETLSMPLWELMHIFGPTLWIGNTQVPFHENRIVIEG